MNRKPVGIKPHQIGKRPARVYTKSNHSPWVNNEDIHVANRRGIHRLNSFSHRALDVLWVGTLLG